MHVHRAATMDPASSMGLAALRQVVALTTLLFAISTTLVLVSEGAQSDAPPPPPSDLTASLPGNAVSPEIIALRNPAKDWTMDSADYRVAPPEPPVELLMLEMLPECIPVGYVSSDGLAEADFLAQARLFSIVRLPDVEDTDEEQGSDDHLADATKDRDGTENDRPVRFVGAEDSSARIFEFTAMPGSVDSIDPSILQLPRIYQVTEVRVVPSATETASTHSAPVRRTTIRRRSHTVSARLRMPLPPHDPNDPLTAMGFKPLSHLSVDTSSEVDPPPDPELQEPEREAVALFESFDEKRDVPTLSAIGLNPQFYLEPADFCHQPLYFEELNLERFGTPTTRLTRAQPVVSGARFFVTVPALPYLMTVYRPRQCYQELNSYRPGRPAPWHRELPPCQLNAEAIQAGLIAGMFFVIP